MRGVDWRQRVIDNVDYFHDVREFKGDHIGLARYIHEKEIQILIEWDGYARQGERAAGLMALRPCPVQILHQEFLMTSGAQYIDYIITDKVVSPLRLEHLYTEKFLYLPFHFFSKGHAMQDEVIPPSFDYVPKEEGTEFQLGVGSPQQNACLSSNPLGSDSADVSFVYCNFNKFLKHNPETVRSWIRILQEVPNSVVCLLENPAEGIPNLRKFVTETTAKNASTSDLNNRIHFLPWEKNPFDHQRRSHSLCNAMLDSHPYNGHTTAQDSLYAGVPIVSRSDGDDMSSRVTTSANIVLGLDELNANGRVEYEDIAIRLGNDKSWFGSIRAKLINTCLQRNPMHPYWDVPRYVKNFERGLTIAWKSFLDGSPMNHIEVLEDDDKMIAGTFDTELIARESKRKERKRKREERNVRMDSEF
jgi:protein O-GlcNAc transferase